MAPFSKKITAPYRADLALTYECNNRCMHCYVARRPGDKPPLYPALLALAVTLPVTSEAPAAGPDAGKTVENAAGSSVTMAIE